RNVVVVDLVRARHRGAIQREIQVVLSSSAARCHGGWRCELRCLYFAVRDRRKRILHTTRTARHGKRRGRCVGSRGDRNRLTGHERTGTVGHLDDKGATAGASRIREVEVETVVAASLGNLALLSRIVEASCR